MSTLGWIALGVAAVLVFDALFVMFLVGAARLHDDPQTNPKGSIHAA